MEHKNLLDVTEAAKLLGVSTRSIQRMVAQNKVQAVKQGKKFFIPESELEKLKVDHLPEKIHEESLKHKQDMVTLLQRMVRIPTEMSGNSEQKLAKLIESELDKMGIRNVIVGKDDKTSVVGSLGYADTGIMLDCPLDTSPAGDLSKWKHPPFHGVIKAGKLFGRGSADSKAGIVCMLYAAKILKKLVPEEQYRIELVFDGGEHNGEYSGMKEVLKKGLDINAGIIGYAGDWEDLAVGCRGYHRYTITVEGEAKHTGSRDKRGINAITKMSDIIQLLQDYPFPSSRNKLFYFGSKLTPAMIRGGTAINIVPDRCELDIDVRTLPDQKRKDVEDYLDMIIGLAKKQDSEIMASYKYSLGEDGYVVEPDSDIFKAMQSSIQDAVGKKIEPVVNGPAHIGALLNKHNIPVLVWGPKGGHVHAYDEYVEIDSLTKTVEIYVNAVLNYFKK